MVRVEELDDLGDGDEPQSPPPASSVRKRGGQEQNSQAVEAVEGTETNQNGEGEELDFNAQVDRAREEMQPSPLEKFMAITKSLILRAMVVYFVMSFIRSSGSKPAATTGPASTGGNAPPASLASSNIFPNGTEFDMYVYVSEESIDIVDFSNDKLIWKQEGLIYGDWSSGPTDDGTHTYSLQLPLSQKIQNNGSLYIHTFITMHGFSPDPQAEKFSKAHTVHSSRMLNKFKKKRFSKTKNLLTGETKASKEDQEKAKTMSSEIISHWHPNLTIALVTDWSQWTLGAVPAPLNEYVRFVPDSKYQPVLFYNDYWNLLKDYTPLNSTTPIVPLTLTFQPLSLFKWQIYAAQSMRNQWNAANFLAGQDDEADEDQDTLKEALIETNPILLGLTFVISLLHSVFEFLAFKNDIQFWNNRKSMEGLSVRSVFFNVFQSLIVLLYVLDNDTNFVIRCSCFVGLGIEIWKINKVMDVKVDRDNLIFGLFPRLSFSDKGSYVESSTRKYDRMAFRYLSWVCFPLLGCYAVYSLLNYEHKGLYSFVLGMMYSFLLTFGFIMMTPQLFINYKLKSVAHLPWRMLTYKFLNTFIDDIFAFVIKMPMMYRIGTLRDDIIFFIYLYQKYIYKVDPTRVNEFGFSAEMLDEKKEIGATGDDTNGAITLGEVEGTTKEVKTESGTSTKSPKTSKKKSKDKIKKDK